MILGPVKKQFSISSLQWRGLRLCLFAISMHGLKDKRIIYSSISAKVEKRELLPPHKVVQQLQEQPGHLWSVLDYFSSFAVALPVINFSAQTFPYKNWAKPCALQKRIESPRTAILKTLLVSLRCKATSLGSSWIFPRKAVLKMTFIAAMRHSSRIYESSISNFSRPKDKKIGKEQAATQHAKIGKDVSGKL